MSSDRADNMWIENLIEDAKAIINGYEPVPETRLDQLLSARKGFRHKMMIKKIDEEIDKEFKKLLTENKKVVY